MLPTGFAASPAQLTTLRLQDEVYTRDRLQHAASSKWCASVDQSSNQALSEAREEVSRAENSAEACRSTHSREAKELALLEFQIQE